MNVFHSLAYDEGADRKEAATREAAQMTRRIFYDTEFLEDGRTIDLISIGMVRDDGSMYYAIVKDDELITRAYDHPWLREHVIPSLPVKLAGVGLLWEWDEDHPHFRDVKFREDIADEVRDFILRYPDTELWADYCAYDHVALCQLFGRMIDLPEGVPMWTHDLRQVVERAGNPRLPDLPDTTEHNALDDAREGQDAVRVADRVRPPPYDSPDPLTRQPSTERNPP